MTVESVPKTIFEKLHNYLHERMVIRQALRCHGWTDKGKLSVLYRMARETRALDGDILEIGSAWGRSAVLLGLASAKRIWSIDPHTGGRAYIERGEVQDSFEIFKANLTRSGLDGRVTILKYTTDEVIEKKLLPESVRFSMVFIDGLHTARGVELDFGLAFERLVRGGIMVFDDYFQESIPDYTEMIDKLAENHGLDLVKDRHSMLVYFTKSR